MEEIINLQNSKYYIDKLSIKKPIKYLYLIILIIFIQIIFLINFKFIKTSYFENKNVIYLKTDDIKVYVDGKLYNGKLNISMENYKYKLNLNLEDNKRIIKIEENLSIMDSILYEIRKDLSNEQTQ